MNIQIAAPVSAPNKTQLPDLPARQGTYACRLLERYPQKFFELVHGIGSPLHCVFPQQFAENIDAVESVFKKYQQSAQIFFAKKANKAQSFVGICRRKNIGLDVASKQEFQLALAEGIKGDQLSVSGPEKSIELLQLALCHGAQIALDSIEEINKLKALVGTTATPTFSNKRAAATRAKVLLRFQPIRELNSRFGISAEQLPIALELLKACVQQLELAGFSFHLSGYDVTARAETAWELIDWIDHARQQGFDSCNQLNIGGGFPISYVNENTWQTFIADIQPSDFHRHHHFPDGFYPYGNPLGITQALDNLLSHQKNSGDSLAQQMRNKNIQLAIEPGRALLDQAGVSAFFIQGIKAITKPDSYQIATVAGMSFSLSEQWFGSEFLPSPVLLKANETSASSHCPLHTVFPTAIAGNSCLECDMLSWRKIPFTRQPDVGDCVVYPNTAGYQMDSNESTFHSVPLTPKVAVWFDDDQMRWQLDSML